MVNCNRIKNTLNCKLPNKIFSFKLNPPSHTVHHRFGYKNIIHESILNYKVCKKWIHIYFNAHYPVYSYQMSNMLLWAHIITLLTMTPFCRFVNNTLVLYRFQCEQISLLLVLLLNMWVLSMLLNKILVWHSYRFVKLIRDMFPNEIHLGFLI